MNWKLPEDISFPAQTSNTKVLIVDDDQTDLNYLVTLITYHGYDFETARNGKEAIDKVRQTKPDVILLDILMPVMNGIEACRRLKGDPETQHIPIIVFTAFGDKETKMECLKAGANDFLTKPIDSAELAARIRNFMQLKKLKDVNEANEILASTVRAVETAKKEWELTLDCINDIVILIDSNDKIKRCNKVLATLTGNHYAGLLSRRWQDVLKEAGFSHKISNSGDIEYFHPSGRFFNYNFYPVMNFRDTGTYAGVITLQDVTDLRNITEELLGNKKILEKKNMELEKAYADLKSAQSQALQQEKMASIGQLAAGVAHEINNPVGFIMSNLGSLQKYTDKLSEFIKAQAEAIEDITKESGVRSQEFSEKLKETRKSLKIDYITEDIGNLIKESLEGADRVKKIVQDLKSFSRVDEAEHKMADINAGIESTINIVWNELKYKATVKREYGDIPMIKCNPSQLNQVFMNILVNAAHAIEKQGEITVKTWHEKDNIYVSISDTGCGIPEDKINRIFEPFYTTKEVGKGTGLGLSITYDIVKKHNGDITVQSEPGKGTTFIVRIPVMEI